MTSLLGQTFVSLTRAPLGFQPSNLAVVDLHLPLDADASRQTVSSERLDLYDRVAARIQEIPGVQRVAASTSPPLFSGGLVSVRTKRDTTQAPDRFNAQDVTISFFETLAMPVIAGRAFDRRDSSASPRVVIVNELAARRLFMTPREAIGRLLFIDQEPREVIGVVGNTASVFFNTLEWQTNPIVYVPASQGFSAITNPERRTFGLSLHVRSSRPLALADIRRAAASVDSRLAITAMEAAETSVAKATQQPRFRMTLLAWFSIGSLLLTAIGVYGLVAQTVERRAREIGIRIALGAQAMLVVRMVARGAIATAVAGALAGCVAALALGGTLTSVIYGVDARDPASMLVAVGALLGIALLAAVIPALRATRIDPIRVLRSE
jgi:putative ABC transport system permease protein